MAKRTDIFKPGKYGSFVKDGKLFDFSPEHILVMAPWPDPRAWVKTSGTGFRVTRKHADEFFRLMEVRLAPWLEREADPQQPHDAGIVDSLESMCGTRWRYVWKSSGYIPFDDAYAGGLLAVAARFIISAGFSIFAVA